jgi:hypothetical protein
MTDNLDDAARALRDEAVELASDMSQLFAGHCVAVVIGAQFELLAHTASVFAQAGGSEHARFIHQLKRLTEHLVTDETTH